MNTGFRMRPFRTAFLRADALTAQPHATDHHDFRSTKMNTLHEALARDRMREREQRSRQAGLAREVAAQRRWHRVSRYAHAAEQRHEARVSQVGGLR